MKTVVIGLLAGWVGLSAAGCAPAEKEAAGAAATTTALPERVVAIGDLHGDLDATRRALKLAGAIDDQDRWIGRNLTVVQTGDELDRGDQDKAIVDLFEQLMMAARAAGGAVIALNGNHEYMNAQGDFRYVSPGGFAPFDALTESDSHQPQLAQLPEAARGRAAAFMPGGPYARLLARRPTILKLGDTVFVHGGVLPPIAEIGIAPLNQAYSDWLAGKSAQIPPSLSDEQGPVWTRLYSDTTQPPACDLLRTALAKLGARHMVVGHTVQPHINPACDQQVWRIDVGMSKSYGGPIEVLEIRDGVFRVLKETP